MDPSGTHVRARHIVFVGGMGAGKSSAARVLAERLGRPLRDNDEQLERSRGRSGRETAARNGVGNLHQAEALYLLEALSAPEPSVIAAAASVVEGDRCLEALKGADVVWLRVGPEAAAERIGEHSHRRSLGPDAVETLTALADRRASAYAAVSDLVIDTDELEVADVADRVQTWLDQRPGGCG